MQTNKKDLPTLTSIRFFAAFAVFLFHFQLQWKLTHLRVLNNIFSQGPVGMSLFFILSGFILAYNYYDLDNPTYKNYGDFLVKRIARIYPVYVLSGIAFIAVGMFNVTKPYFFLKTFYLLVTNIFLIQGWLPPLFGYWNDGGTWSLSVEAFCYLTFPFLLFHFSQKTTRVLIFSLCIFYILSIVPGASCLFDSNTSFATIYALPIYRLPEFIIGIIVGIYFIKTDATPAFLQVKLVTLVCIALLWLGIIGQKLPYFVGHNIFIIPAFSYLIFYTASLKKGFLFRLLNNNFLKLLGESSYSFYLLQGIPIILVKKYYPFISTTIPALQHIPLLFMTVLSLAVCLSILSYFYIEKPLRKTTISLYVSLKLQRKRKQFELNQPISSF